MNTAADWLRDRRAIAAVIVLATLATFGVTIGHDFVGGWDDRPLIVNNELVNPPTTESLRAIWTGPHARMYIPAVYTTWWALAQVAPVGGTLQGSTTLNPYDFAGGAARDDYGAVAGATVSVTGGRAVVTDTSTSVFMSTGVAASQWAGFSSAAGNRVTFSVDLKVNSLGGISSLLANGKSERGGQGPLFSAIVLVDVTPRVDQSGVPADR